MDIERIDLHTFQKDNLDSEQVDGIRHIKTLPYLSVVQAIEGSYEIQLGNGCTYSTGTGGFFLAPSNIQQTITHHAPAKGARMVCRWVFLDARVNGLHTFDELYEFPVLLPEACQAEMQEVFDRLFAAETVFHEYSCYYEILRILASVSIKKEKDTPPYLETALQYIQTQYQAPITVKDIAKSVNLSEAYLFSVFKKHLGVSPIAFLNNYRLSLAVEYLLTTDKHICEIANLVGIRDAVYFNKLFRKTYQLAPRQYRNIYKNSKIQAPPSKPLHRIVTQSDV